ncbi:MAG: hypothetical protein IAF38_20820 [Bacteroidia bacterium]|nr:hypothetical protein [Bacteroidia bacterium]
MRLLLIIASFICATGLYSQSQKEKIFIDPENDSSFVYEIPQKDLALKNEVSIKLKSCKIRTVEYFLTAASGPWNSILNGAAINNQTSKVLKEMKAPAVFYLGIKYDNDGKPAYVKVKFKIK